MKFILLLLSISIGFAEDSYSVKKYFGAFEGYDHPVTMVDELDGAEVIEAGKRSYYVAEYNKYDLLIRMRKVFKKEEIYRYEYRYHSDGQIKESKIYRRGKLVNTIKAEKE